MDTEPCPYCLADVRVSWWHQALGLATRCRQCEAFSGPSWSLRRLVVALVASVILNGLVLFLVARPIRALGLLLFYVGTVVGLFAAADATGNETLLNTALVTVILGPLCLASLEFYWHAVELSQGPRLPVVAQDDDPATGDEPSDGDAAPLESDGPRFLGSAQIETLRNELEIAIYHEVDQLEWITYVAYAISLLGILLAVLERRWSDVSVGLVLGGIAQTTRAHESRLFAVAYSLAGAGLIGRFAWARVAHAETAPSYALPLSVFMLGLGLAKTTITLARLRRLRRQILLDPAAHLQD